MSNHMGTFLCLIKGGKKCVQLFFLFIVIEHVKILNKKREEQINAPPLLCYDDIILGIFCTIPIICLFSPFIDMLIVSEVG